MSYVTLKNGSQESDSVVRTRMKALERLIELDLVLFCELVIKCRNGDHRFDRDTSLRLRTLFLVQPGDKVEQSIINVVLSAVQGEGLDMELGSPSDDPTFIPKLTEVASSPSWNGPQ